MEERWSIDINFIEQGDIYFFYKPKKSIEEVKSINDVSRLFFVLSPSGGSSSRYIVLGNKVLPKVDDGGKSSWGFVQMVGGRGFDTERESFRPVKGASRPAGEGIYLIAKHRDHTHLLYLLELPTILGEVQKSFNIQKEANYLFLNRPVSVQPNSPDTPFSNFSPINSVENLNKRGTEVLLLGIGSDIGRLGIKGEKDVETLKTADVFSKLKVDPNRHPTKSLISGEWE